MMNGIRILESTEMAEVAGGGWIKRLVRWVGRQIPGVALLEVGIEYGKIVVGTAARAIEQTEDHAIEVEVSTRLQTDLQNDDAWKYLNDKAMSR